MIYKGFWQNIIKLFIVNRANMFVSNNSLLIYNECLRYTINSVINPDNAIFIISTLNKLNIDKIRNDIILQVIPVKV